MDQEDQRNQMERLRDITRSLREPGGCDWDRAQNYESMRPHLIEEAYEIIDAVDRKDYDELKGELGDMLFLVYFFARLAEEEGRFVMDDVAREVSDKLVRRHPHVFGDLKVNGVDEILRNWDKIKQSENSSDGKNSAKASGESTGNADDGLPSENGPARESALKKTEDYLPALFRAFKIQTRAARAGFDWKTPQGPLDKIKEETAEVEAEAHKAMLPDGTIRIEDRAAMEDELGDLLFSVVNLSRHFDINPETVLKKATDKFIVRFRQTEILAQDDGVALSDCDETQLEKYWERVKAG